MSKTKKYALKGAVIVGLIKAALNTAKQLDEMTANPDRKFNWKALMQEAGEGAVIGGIGGGIIGTIADHQNGLEKPLNTDSFL